MALAALPDDADINASTTVTKLVGFAPGMPISFKRHNYNFISERLWNKKIYKLSYAIGLLKQNARFIRWSWDNGRGERAQQYFTNINLLLRQCSYILHSQTFGDPTDLLGNILTEEKCIKNEQSTTVMCYLTENLSVSYFITEWASYVWYH